MPLHPDHKILGQAQKTAKIIVDQADIHPLRGLAHQNLFHATPHFAGADNEVFQKDEFLGFFQIGQQLRVHGLSAGKVPRLCLIPYRERTVPGHIAAQARKMIPRQLPRRPGLLGQISRVGFLHALHPAAHPFGGCFVAKHQIQGSAQQRQQTDQNDPDDLIRAVLILADQIQHDEQTEQPECRIDPYPACGQVAERPEQPAHLQQNKGHRNGSPVEKSAEKFYDWQSKEHPRHLSPRSVSLD